MVKTKQSQVLKVLIKDIFPNVKEGLVLEWYCIKCGKYSDNSVSCEHCRRPFGASDENKTKSNIGKIIGVLGVLAVVFFAFLIFNAGKPKEVETKPPINIIPAVSKWLEERPYYGTPKAVTEIPDWAMGKRQTVTLSSASGIIDYIFYLQGDSVVTVYKINSTGERIEVWRK